MLSVLLIDDEYIILKGIEAMLSAQQSVRVRVAPFLDSVEALAKIDEIRPDVIITDINMPELNGLALIEQAMAAGYQGQFLIISGYEELEYLKRAIEYHVTDYLIKPINKQKLIDSLVRLDEIKREREQTLLFKLTMSLTFEPIEFSAQRDPWHTLLPQPHVALIATQTADDVLEQTLERLNTYFTPTYLMRHGALAMFLCCAGPSVSRGELLSVWQACAASPNDFVGVSGTLSTDRLISQLSDGSVTLLLDALADGIQRWTGCEAFDRPPLTFELGRALLHPQDKAELERSYQALADGEPRAFERGYVEIAAAQAAHLGYLLPQAAQLELLHRVQAEATGIQGLRTALFALPQRYLQAMQSDGRAGGQHSEKIEKAVQYLKSHFMEDVSLGVVAEHVGLSQSYLSAAFSREVGVTFLDYLHQQRMEVACHLLSSNPSLSIERIAARVGYQTAGHFYKVFKATFGASPNRWREQQTEGAAADGKRELGAR